MLDVSLFQFSLAVFLIDLENKSLMNAITFIYSTDFDGVCNIPAMTCHIGMCL